MAAIARHYHRLKNCRQILTSLTGISLTVYRARGFLAHSCLWHTLRFYEERAPEMSGPSAYLSTWSCVLSWSFADLSQVTLQTDCSPRVPAREFRACSELSFLVRANMSNTVWIATDIPWHSFFNHHRPAPAFPGNKTNLIYVIRTWSLPWDITEVNI